MKTETQPRTRLGELLVRQTILNAVKRQAVDNLCAHPAKLIHQGLTARKQ